MVAIVQAPNATTASDHSGEAQDLILRGQALLCVEDQVAGLATVPRAVMVGFADRTQRGLRATGARTRSIANRRRPP